jgi:hypothetical protein
LASDEIIDVIVLPFLQNLLINWFLNWNRKQSY